MPVTTFPDYELPDQTTKRRNLAELFREIDWDITKSELIAAWNQGQKESFYPYGKTILQALAEED